ncbi:KAP family P-loop domain protein [Pleurocapsales cyanobacterium LEGE 10410]|nr:KAP family P-loop domain protein [Pleurocapsales cyanobacterium LEGE 10410]
MWADRESEIDYLNFSEISEQAVDVITAPGMLPISLGVFGNWGAGKSTLLKLIEKDLRTSEGLSSRKKKEYILVNFNAWRYQGYDDSRAALLEVIGAELNKEAKDNEPLHKKTKNLLARINIFRILGFGAEGLALAHGVPTGGFLARIFGATQNLVDSVQEEKKLTGSEYQDLEKLAKDGKETMGEFFKDTPQITPPQQIAAFQKEYSEILKELDSTLVVFIDNLDRCLPRNAIQTLEAISLFLFLPNTAFVIAADEEMIRGSVGEYFKGTSNRHQIDYIDKLIQFPIQVPKAGIREIRAYLFMLFAIDKGLDEQDLVKIRSKLESSLQQSWKSEPIKVDKLLEIIDQEDKDNLRQAFDLANRITPILATSPNIQGNPRIVKRLLNVIKMRSNIAKRRKMPIDENIIAKLVIFERCAGASATLDLYQLIDSKAGKPEIFEQLESTENDNFPNNAPSSWKDKSDFIMRWSKLKPQLSDVDLRAAIYLSRATMPIGVYTAGLSEEGQEALRTLAETKKMTSPGADSALKQLPKEDEILVMEELVNKLRQVSSWENQPVGFAGACKLAEHSEQAAKIFIRYLSSLLQQPPWMKAMLKKKTWYEGV